MLKITVPAYRIVFDGVGNFINTKEQTLQLGAFAGLSFKMGSQMAQALLVPQGDVHRRERSTTSGA